MDKDLRDVQPTHYLSEELTEFGFKVPVAVVDGVTYRDCPSLYRKVVSMFSEGILPTYTRLYNLVEQLCMGHSIVLEKKDYLSIGEWVVDQEILFHIHGDVKTLAAEDGVVVYTLHGRHCSLCGEEIPGTIWMTHRLWKI